MIALVTKKLIPTVADRQIAKFAALAMGFALIDATIPSPLPGVKPGLANIVTLVVLMRFGFVVAMQVTMLRIIASSLLFGGFLSPGFFMSVAGGTCSLVALRLIYRLPALGPIGCSIIAAFAHIIGQLLLARLWLIPHAGIWFLLPIFLSAAFVFGLVNGLVAAKVLQNARDK
jgi:heptaprenyl diphosphate synthase